jgi:hypothetical protein
LGQINIIAKKRIKRVPIMRTIAKIVNRLRARPSIDCADLAIDRSILDELQQAREHLEPAKKQDVINA